MDHEQAVREMMAEKYLLNELSLESREEFEEHFFGCSECAEDVKAGIRLIAGFRAALKPLPAEEAPPASKPIPEKSDRFAWLRPGFAFALLLILVGVVGYQNLITYPQLKLAANSPQVLPWASVSVSARGGTVPLIRTHAGEGFLLFVNIPPDSRYSSYITRLQNPEGKTEWSITVPASSEDSYPVHVPAATRQAGNYTLAVEGLNSSGQKTPVGQSPFELQIQ